MKQESNGAQKLDEHQEEGAPSQMDSTFGSVFGSQENGSQLGGAPGSEFGSAFESSSAMSQVFSESGVAKEDKKKRYVFVGVSVLAVAVCGVLISYILMDSPGEEAVPPTVPSVNAANPNPPPGTVAKAETAAPAATIAQAEKATPAAQETIGLPTPEAAASPVPAEKPETAAKTPTEVKESGPYAESLNGPVVKNLKDGAIIEVSRVQDFSSLYVTGPAVEGAFRIPQPPSGAIYWREKGATEANKIEIGPSPSLGVRLAAPAQVSTNGELHWSASGSPSYFRMEFANDASFTNIYSVFSTKALSGSVKDISPGKYFVRVGGLNVASGMWEFSKPREITIQ